MSFVEKVFDYLNKNSDYAVLRNYEGLPKEIKSRDIDIIIPKQGYKKIEKDLFKIAKEDGYKTLIINRSERFDTVIWGKVSEGKSDIIQFDFFFHMSVYGQIVVTPEEMLRGKCFNGKIYHVNKLDEFLDKYLFNTMVGEKYPDKYKKIRDVIENSYKKELEIQLKKIFNLSTLEEVEALGNKKLNSLVKRRNYKKNPVKQLKNTIGFYYYYIEGYFRPKGFSIGFTGPDGAGKTTVLEMVKISLEEVMRDNQVNHFRPDIFPRIAEIMNKSGVKKEVDTNYDKPHRGKETSVISSIMRLCYYGLDYIVGYWLKVRKVLVRRGFVIFDRYYEDIITDSKRSQINLKPNLINLIGKVIPKMNYHILLTADPEIILSRKQEITKEKIVDINRNLEYLAGSEKRYLLVKNNGTAEEAVTKILNHIFDKQDRKNK